MAGPRQTGAPGPASGALHLDEILLRVGKLNYTWSNTESLLIHLIAGLARIDKDTALIIFLTLNTTRARLAHPLPENAVRQHYMRAIVAPGAPGEMARVSTIRSQDSSLLSPLAQSTGLIVRPPYAPALPEGAEVDVLPLDF